MKRKQWAIFDLDGTLADIKHRLHHIKGDKPNWDTFNKMCTYDEPKHDIIQLLQILANCGFRIAIFSGRMDNAMTETKDWLKRHHVHYDVLAMRKTGDYRSDTAVKEEMLKTHLYADDVLIVVDDRDKVVKLWRDLGLTCLQCQPGDY